MLIVAVVGNRNSYIGMEFLLHQFTLDISAAFLYKTAPRRNRHNVSV